LGYNLKRLAVLISICSAPITSTAFGIVLMTMLVAIGLFKELVSRKGYVGIAIAVTSILFLYLAHTQ